MEKLLHDFREGAFLYKQNKSLFYLTPTMGHSLNITKSAN